MDQPMLMSIRHDSGIEKKQLFVKIIENMLHGIMITDKDCNIIYINPAFTKITGYSKQDAIGKNPRIMQSGKHNNEFYQQMWLSITQTNQWQGELWNRTKDGKIYCELLNISAIKNDAGEIANYVAVLFDITDRKMMENRLLDLNLKLKHLSVTDGLTGIANRRYFDKQLEREFRRAVRNAKPLSLIMVDIDFFKYFNDAYGHQKGDECLKRVASVLYGTLKRPRDLAARYGGEEFAIILPDTDPNGAAMVAGQIQSNIAALKIPHIQSQTSNYVTVSMGAATVIPGLNCTAEELLIQADKALYQAKQEGRNRVIQKI